MADFVAEVGDYGQLVIDHEGFEFVTCGPLILAVLNYAGLREAGLCGGWWSNDKLGKPAEILRDCRQRELELSTSRAAQAQTIEPQDTLEMGKQHRRAMVAAKPAGGDGPDFRRPPPEHS